MPLLAHNLLPIGGEQLLIADKWVNDTQSQANRCGWHCAVPRCSFLQHLKSEVKPARLCAFGAQLWVVLTEWHAFNAHSAASTYWARLVLLNRAPVRRQASTRSRSDQLGQVEQRHGLAGSACHADRRLYFLQILESFRRADHIGPIKRNIRRTLERYRSITTGPERHCYAALLDRAQPHVLFPLHDMRKVGAVKIDRFRIGPAVGEHRPCKRMGTGKVPVSRWRRPPPPWSRISAVVSTLVIRLSQADTRDRMSATAGDLTHTKLSALAAEPIHQ